MSRKRGKILRATWWAEERPISFGHTATPPPAATWTGLAHLTNQEAARVLGVGASTVARWRRAAGQARPEGGPPRYSLIMGETTRLILLCHIQNGLSAAHIATASGLGVATVQALCRRHGLRFRVGRPPKRAA